MRRPTRPATADRSTTRSLLQVRSAGLARSEAIGSPRRSGRRDQVVPYFDGGGGDGNRQQVYAGRGHWRGGHGLRVAGEAERAGQTLRGGQADQGGHGLETG